MAVRQPNIDLGINDERLAVSDHVAYFWETDDEFERAVGFLETGLQGKDHCVIFGHRKANQKICAILKSHGFDHIELRRIGRLSILNGRHSGEEMLTEIGDTFQRARASGAPLIRLLGNIGWGHADWPEENEILEFEARVTAACRDFRCAVVCMYDVRKLSGRIMVRGAYETHPLTFCGNVLRENPHHVPIEDFLRDLKRAS
jgi:DcmR-like sensory protein